MTSPKFVYILFNSAAESLQFATEKVFNIKIAFILDRFPHPVNALLVELTSVKVSDGM